MVAAGTRAVRRRATPVPEPAAALSRHREYLPDFRAKIGGFLNVCFTESIPTKKVISVFNFLYGKGKVLASVGNIIYMFSL